MKSFFAHNKIYRKLAEKSTGLVTKFIRGIRDIKSLNAVIISFVTICLLLRKIPISLYFTIRENLMIIKPNATENEMMEACKTACLHDFIISLPDGYDTKVGEGVFPFLEDKDSA